METLPFVDEHRLRMPADREATWAALLRVLGSGRSGGATLARLLGCDPRHGTPAFDGRVGDAVPGFRIVEADSCRRLALRGRHRFAVYALTFVLDDGSLSARTEAAFPGAAGRLYRVLVIGTGAHRWVTRWILRRVGRAARLARRPAASAPETR